MLGASSFVRFPVIFSGSRLHATVFSVRASRGVEEGCEIRALVLATAPTFVSIVKERGARVVGANLLLLPRVI